QGACHRHGENGGPGPGARRDPARPPQVLVVGRTQVEVREGQGGEGESPDPDDQPSPRPQGPFLRSQFEGDLFGRLVQVQEALGALRPLFGHGFGTHKIGGRGSRSSRPPGDNSSGSTGSEETWPAATSSRPRSATGGASRSP